MFSSFLFLALSIFTCATASKIIISEHAEKPKLKNRLVLVLHKLPDQYIGYRVHERVDGQGPAVMEAEDGILDVTGRLAGILPPNFFATFISELYIFRLKFISAWLEPNSFKQEDMILSLSETIKLLNDKVKSGFDAEISNPAMVFMNDFLFTKIIVRKKKEEVVSSSVNSFTITGIKSFIRYVRPYLFTCHILNPEFPSTAADGSLELPAEVQGMIMAYLGRSLRAVRCVNRFFFETGRVRNLMMLPCDKSVLFQTLKDCFPLWDEHEMANCLVACKYPFNECPEPSLEQMIDELFAQRWTWSDLCPVINSLQVFNKIFPYIRIWLGPGEMVEKFTKDTNTVLSVTDMSSDKKFSIIESILRKALDEN